MSHRIQKVITTSDVLDVSKIQVCFYGFDFGGKGSTGRFGNSGRGGRGGAGCGGGSGSSVDSGFSDGGEVRDVLVVP